MVSQPTAAAFQATTPFTQAATEARDKTGTGTGEHMTVFVHHV